MEFSGYATVEIVFAQIRFKSKFVQYKFIMTFQMQSINEFKRYFKKYYIVQLLLYFCHWFQVYDRFVLLVRGIQME